MVVLHGVLVKVIIVTDNSALAADSWLKIYLTALLRLALMTCAF